MGDASFLQSSFAGGEWSLHMQGRYDRPDYRTAMVVCFNSFPVEEGGWHKRPGTRNAGHTRNGAAGRLYTFDFQESTPYNIEYTDSFMRFRNGYTLALTNDAATVTAISSVNPAVVTLSGAVTWSTADQAMFSSLGTQCPLLQNRQFKLTKIDTTHFSLQNSLTGANIDGSTLGTYTSGAKLGRILEVASPYTGTSWQSVRQIQAETQAVLVNGTIKPYILTASPPSGNNFATFSLVSADFRDGPYLDPNVQSNVAIYGSNGVVVISLQFQTYDATAMYAMGDYVFYNGANYQSLINQNQGYNPATATSQWSSVSAGLAISSDGFETTDVGRHVRLYSQPQLWNPLVAYNINDVILYNDVAYVAIASGIPVGQSPDFTAAWSLAASHNKWTWGKVIGAVSVLPASSGATHISGPSWGSTSSAFDGVYAKTHGGAVATSSNTTASYIGQNYSVAQKIHSGVIYPSSDQGFNNGGATTAGMTINMRAKHTSPSSATDGTLLGTVSGFGPDSKLPISILSNDAATAWEYVWFELNSGSNNTINTVSQVQFFTPATFPSNTVALQIYGDQIPNFLATPLIQTWRLGIYNDRDGYPTNGVYHDGRLWLAGAIGNRIDSSRSNALSIINGAKVQFDPTEPDGTVSDSCGISYVFTSKDVNPVFAMMSDANGIICLTQGCEYLVQATTQNPTLTPTNIKENRVTDIGSANIEPRQCGLTYVFVQRFTRKLIEFFSDVFSGRQAAPNLSLKAKHLFTAGVAEIAYQREKTPILWTRLADGSLKGISYKRENLRSGDDPTLSGAHRHTLGSGRIVESIVVGANGDGTLDSLSMVTNDSVSNIRHVEVLTDVLDEGSPGSAAWFLDDAVVPTSTTTATAGGQMLITLNGLWHLNGKTVAVFAGGLDLGNYAVSNGSAVVKVGTPALFTQSFINSFSGNMPIVVGFPYTAQGQIVRLNAPAESGARNGPAFGKLRRLDQALFQVESTQGLQYGTSFSKLRTLYFDSPGGTRMTELQLFSGVYRSPIEDADSFDGQLCWQSTRPYPATIVAVGGFAQTKDV